MSKKEEAKIQAKIIRELKKIPGCVALPHTATPYSPTGHTDVYGTIHGYGYWGEVKDPIAFDPEPTKIQDGFAKQVGKGVLIKNTFVWLTVSDAVSDIQQLSKSVMDLFKKGK